MPSPFTASTLSITEPLLPLHLASYAPGLLMGSSKPPTHLTELNKTCPNVESIVGGFVRDATQFNPQIPAIVPRRHFHDCFVQVHEILDRYDVDCVPDTFKSNKVSVAPMYNSTRGESFDDAEPYFGNSKQPSKARGLPDNSLLKSFAPKKEKASSVAKIKVVYYKTEVVAKKGIMGIEFQVRKRPLNKKELAKNEEDIITTEPHSSSLAVHETKLKVDLTEYMEKHKFVFDAVLNKEVSNDEPIVPIIFQRTKSTCFVYGQTGSGNTFTMKPLPLKVSRDILRLVNHTYRSQGFHLYFSFFEIYGGKLYDLLNDRKKLCMREDGKQQLCIVGLQKYRVSGVETIKEWIERGNTTRSTGTTGANGESSRSHAILQLVCDNHQNWSTKVNKSTSGQQFHKLE